MILGSETTIVASSYETEGGTNQTSRFLFFANGAGIGEVPASAGSPGGMQAEILWSPTTAGEYQLQAEAIVNNAADDRGGVSTGVRVCVLDLPTDIIRENIPGNFVARGYSGPCPLPPPNPSNPNDTSFNFVVGTNAGFFAYPTDACPSLDLPVVNFTATVDHDPSDQLALIVVDITWGEGFAAVPVALTPSGVGPAGEKIYTGGWSLEDIFGDYDGSPIMWTAFAVARNGSLLGRADGMIVMSPCIPGEGKPEVEITPTNTPGSAKDCPAGTYFADATFQCIPIQIIPANPDGGSDGGGGNSCPSSCAPGQDQLPYPNCSCIG